MKIRFFATIYDFKYEDTDLNEAPRIKLRSLSDEEKSDLKLRLNEIGEEFVNFCVSETKYDPKYERLTKEPLRELIAQPYPIVKMKIRSKSINFYIRNEFIKETGYKKKEILEQINAEISDGFFSESYRWKNAFDEDPKYILWF